MGNDRHHREKEKHRACERDKKHVREKEQSCSKHNVGAVVKYEKERKHVKEEGRHSYEHVYERVWKEEQVVVQRGKDVFVQRKVKVEHRERVKVSKEPDLRISKHNVRVEYRVPSSLPAAVHGNRRLLLK